MQVPLAVVFDSDASIRASAAEVLRAAGVEPVEVTSPQRALEVLRARPVAIAVFGFASSSDTLYDLVERGLRLRPTAVVAVLEGDRDGALVPAARAGIFELLSRPPDHERLAAFAWRALRQHGLLEELRRLKAEEAGGNGTIVGRSEAAEALRRRLARLAEGGAAVLFVGEPGSGRTHAARSLAARKGIELEVVLAGAPDAEIRLFGDAPSGRTGVLARGVSVHLADVDRLSWAGQQRVAAALAAEPGPARVTASSTFDPGSAAGEGRLHPALAEALAPAVVRLPPLRERREDIPLLARAFVESLRRLNALPPILVAPDALSALEEGAWPGNVRELRDAVETAVILAADGTLRARDLPGHAASPSARAGLRADRRFRDAKRAVVDAFERSYLVDLLERHRGNVTGAAGQSGMLRSALQRLLRKHDLQSAAFRADAGAKTGSGTT